MQQQAVGARQVGRRDFADRRTVAKQVNEVNAHPIKHSDRLMKAAQCVKARKWASGKGWGCLLYPDVPRSIGQVWLINLLKRNGRHEETRTPDLYRVNLGPIGFKRLTEPRGLPK